MLNEYRLSAERLVEILLPLAVLLITVGAGFLVRHYIFRSLTRLSDRSKTKLDDIVVKSVRGPFLLWSLMLAIYFALLVSRLPAQMVDFLGKVLLVLGVLSVTLVLSNISSLWIKNFSGREATRLPAATLTESIARLFFFTLGLLIILNSLGISITPLLATLGVGGLAVALALQDTLANLFSGFYIVLSRQIRIGDYVRLETGEEGYVTDFNWRSTKIKMLPNNTVLVPNLKLAQAIVINYYLPDKELAVLVDVGVHYSSDLEKVEQVTCEVGREVMREVAGGVPGFQPFIRFNKFDQSSINFTAILRGREFVDQYLVKHEFIKRLTRRYRQEGITIPYPIRALNYEQEKAPPPERPA